jgi:putative inorganic carbon (hco3(-)) transporter
MSTAVPSAPRRALGYIASAGALTASVGLVAEGYRVAPAPTFALLVLVTALPALAYVAWCSHPAPLLSVGLLLALFSGNWGNLGLPELIAPDRLLMYAAIAVVVFRGPAMRLRDRIEIQPIHWLLALTVAYVLVSAFVAGTLFDRAALLRLADRVGAVPYVLFAVAPVIFRSARSRSMLLAMLVAAGCYLALTAFFEVVGAQALVFPRYINNPAIGIHVGRARGPFLEAAGNGAAIYICLVASVVAAVTWVTRWQRGVAIMTALLCSAALVLTLTRSVWVGAAVATVITMLAHPRLRRWLVPVLVGSALVTVATVATVPGLETKVLARESQRGPIYDRLNLNRAALNMVEARPLTGFGWDRFKDVGTNYFQIGDFPLTAGVGVGVHNAYFSHLAELGLVGTSLWLLSLLLAIWLALSRRGPPELHAWRYGLLAIAILNLVVSAFVYPYMFSIVVLWVWAGIVYGVGRTQTSAHQLRSPALESG